MTMISKHLNAASSSLTTEQYHVLYKQSITDPQIFWAAQAQDFLEWLSPWQAVMTGSLADHNVRWFVGGELNVCYNCLDRHLSERADKTAIIWEGDEPSQSQQFSYRELHEAVCRLANGLRSLGIKKGDCVCLYMPMIPEAVVAMLACARIGAVHSVVFGGFSPQALKQRILDAKCQLVITADESVRGGKRIPLKANVDEIIDECRCVKHTLVVQHTQAEIAWHKNDVNYQELMAQADIHSAFETMESNDPLFILYTSGSTGKPKGILHGSGGYAVYAAMTFKYVFDYQEDDVFWCTADVGWITGHSYLVYGPLLNGATMLMFAGVPHYPDASRFWEVIDKHRVSVFYTAPTAIRALIREGDAFVKKTSRDSLRLLGTVGEPINPEAWRWYYNVVGEKRCPIVDTWWQTETGGIMLTPLPYATPLEPGAASWPFFGVMPAIFDEQGNPVKPNEHGTLVMTQAWPGMLQTIYGDHDRFVDTYFSQYPGTYCTGDSAMCDEAGYYWITGRIDDVINVSGHRLDTAEIENAIVEQPNVAEAAVVGYPHLIKGQGICVFVTLKQGVKETAELSQFLVQQVRKAIGSIASPDKILFTKALPKTRSGKIMRRILRKLVCGEQENLGDTSTLANPEVIKKLQAMSVDVPELVA